MSRPPEGDPFVIPAEDLGAGRRHAGRGAAAAGRGAPPATAMLRVTAPRRPPRRGGGLFWAALGSL